MEIRLGPAASDQSPRAGFEATPGCFELTVPEVARYEVRDGKSITILPIANADEDAVRLYFLGSLLGALLHQRGVLPLHGAAASTDTL